MVKNLSCADHYGNNHTQGFSESNLFSDSYLFDPTSPFSHSSSFSKANPFSESQKFSSSSAFSPSTHFTPSLAFSQSEQFSIETSINSESSEAIEVESSCGVEDSSLIYDISSSESSVEQAESSSANEVEDSSVSSSTESSFDNEGASLDPSVDQSGSSITNEGAESSTANEGAESSTENEGAESSANNEGVKSSTENEGSSSESLSEHSSSEEPPNPFDGHCIVNDGETNSTINNRCNCSAPVQNDVIIYAHGTNFTNYEYIENGSAIHIINCGLRVANTSFINCHASNGCGGAICIYNITIESSLFTHCSALYGGAAYFYPSSTYNDANQNTATVIPSSNNMQIGGGNANVQSSSYKGSKGKGGSTKVYNIFNEDPQPEGERIKALEERSRSILKIIEKSQPVLFSSLGKMKTKTKS